jgi:ribose transport system ATP-binding protein
MREIKQIADRITVLRDGHKIKTVAAADVSETELVELMTGRKIGVLFPTIAHLPGQKLLEVEHVTLADRSVNDVSFHGRAGEITGIAGLVGCGKSEIVRAIVGLEPIETGTIRVRGKDVASPTPSAMLKNGVCYFPSDRVAEGLALARPVRENVSMAALDLPGFSRHRILQRRSERRIVQGIVEKLSLRPPLIELAVASFSGSNRQKILLARGLTRYIAVYLFDEPTVGVDEGAKIKIYDWWRRGSQSFWFLPTCRRFSTSRIGSMSCIDPAWRPSSPAPTSANRRCCRISSASNKPPVLPRTPWQRTTPRRTRSLDWNGNERQIDQR